MTQYLSIIIKLALLSTHYSSKGRNKPRYIRPITYAEMSPEGNNDNGNYCVILE